VAILVALTTFLGLYVFLVIRNPDALRSERYALQARAFELFGDDRTGLRRRVDMENLSIVDTSEAPLARVVADADEPSAGAKNEADDGEAAAQAEAEAEAEAAQASAVSRRRRA
jgi:hypothetical protein